MPRLAHTLRSCDRILSHNLPEGGVCISRTEMPNSLNVFNSSIARLSLSGIFQLTPNVRCALMRLLLQAISNTHRKRRRLGLFTNVTEERSLFGIDRLIDRKFCCFLKAA